MRSLGLICTACGKEYSDGHFRCECGEPLEVVIEKKKTVKIGFHRSGILNSFSDLLPGLEDKNSLSLGEGFTPLTRLGDTDSSGMELYAKNESVNPTWSFKDRGSYLAVLDAILRGYNHIGTVSTGNMAASVAAYGKRAGLETTILVSDSIPDEKVSPISIYGCRIIKVAGDYSQLYYNSLEAGRNSGIYFANSDVPMRVEGSKTIAFEVFLQLGERVPDFVVVPTSSGGNLRGIEKGFRELRDSGLSASIPRLIVAQAKGCCPIDLAFSSRASEITRFDYPKTIAHAIENPYPPSGNAVLRILKKNDGMTVAIDEANILKAQRSLANNGLFVQPASAVAYAALSKLRSEMDLRKAIVVAVLTGSGLKYPAILKEHSSYVESTALASLEEVLKKRPTLH
jgi:threonine synthase